MKTKYGVEIPTDATGRPLPDNPEKYIGNPWNRKERRMGYISPKNALCFEFDGEGSWESESRFHEGGVPFSWRILVCEDGTFDVSQSTRELLGMHKPNTFNTFVEAVAFCDDREGDDGLDPEDHIIMGILDSAKEADASKETYGYSDPQDV